jgi:hypothetical protein
MCRLSSGLLRCVVFWLCANVSDERAASTISVSPSIWRKNLEERLYSHRSDNLKFSYNNFRFTFAWNVL